MLLDKSLLWRGFTFAPSGKAADAADVEDTEDDDGEADDAANGDDDKGEEKAEADDDEPAADDPEDAEEDDDEPAPARAKLNHGLEGFSDDPDEFQKQVFALRQGQAEAERYRQYSQLLQQQLEMQRQMAAQNAPPAPKAEAWQAPWGKAPDFDPARLQHITAEDLQNDLMLKNQYQQFMDWQRKGTQSLLNDPVGALYPGLQPKINEEVQRIVQEQLRQHQTMTELRQFTSQNSEWLYDQSGRLTPLGQVADQHYQQALQFGVPNPIDYAQKAVDSKILEYRLAEEQAAKNRPATKTNAQKKAEFSKDAATRKPNRSGTLERPTRKTPASSGKRDIWRKLEQELASLPPEDFSDLN